MKRLLCALLLLCSLGYVNAEEVTIQQLFYSYMKETQEFSRNTEGSAEEKALLTWMTEELTAVHIPYEMRDFHEARDYFSFSSILSVDIPGKRKDTLIFVVPINGVPETESTSGMIGLSSALTAVRHFHRHTPTVSMKFLFLGAEYGPAPVYPLGTRYFLVDYFAEDPTAVLYFDLQSPSEYLRLQTGGEKVVAPRWLVKTVSQTLRRNDISFEYSSTETLTARLGVLDSLPPIDPFLQAGYPAIFLRGLPETGTDEIWIDRWIGFLETLSSTLDDGIPSAWDRNYLFLHLPNRDIVLGETSFITILIVLFSCLMAYPLLFSRPFRRYARAVVNHAFLLPALLVAIYLFLLVGTLPVRLIPTLQGFSDIWKKLPFHYFALKCTGAVLLFMLLFRLVRHIPFPRNSSFYSGATILFLILDIIILSTMDIALTVYVVWALCFAFLFTLMPNKYLKILCFLLSMTWLFIIVYDLFTLPAIRVCGFLIYSAVTGNLLISFILLPFLLMLLRIDLLFAHPKTLRRNIITRSTFFVLLGAFGYLTITLSLYSPYSDEQPQPFYVAETLAPGGHTAVLSSPGRLKEFGKNELSLILPEILPERFLETHLTTTTFLDRMNISLVLKPVGTPEEISVTFTSREQTIIYDSSHPYSADPDSPSVIFHLGRNPPEDLTLETTLPSVQEGVFHITASYNMAPFTLQPGEIPWMVYRSLRVEKILPIVPP